MAWHVGAARNLPINDDKSWSGQDAENSIFAWAGWGGDDPDPTKARKGFLVFSDENPEQKGSYKLPFAMVLDGKLTAIGDGVRNCASRLPQTDGLSQSVQDDARAVIDHYMNKLHDDSGSNATETDRAVVYATAAPIITRATGSDQLQLAKSRALDPAIFDEFTPFFWDAEISSSRLDAYKTHMLPSTLRNFAEDATDGSGVAFQDSHRTDGLERSFGRSLSAKYTRAHGDNPDRTTASFYTLQGMDPAIDGFVNKVRAGIAKDVSVGFYDGTWTCDLCGRDLLHDWDCPHIPGLTYDIYDENGKPTGETRMATAGIDGAHLAETSTVYDGATPSATILKAQREVDAGHLRPHQARLLEARYRIKLPGALPVYRGIDIPSQEAQSMPPEKDDKPTTDPFAAIRTALTDAGVTHEDALSGVKRLIAEVERLRPLEAEVKRLQPLADMGTQYRQDLIDEAIAEGIRAKAEGETFAEETYRGILNALDIEQVKTMRDDWRAKAASRFPGGRLTKEPELEHGGHALPSIPNAAHAA